MALGVSTKLLYTLSPVSTGLGGHLRAGIPPRHVTSHPRGHANYLQPLDLVVNWPVFTIYLLHERALKVV